MIAARQVDFDQIVRELLEEGQHSWGEAVREAQETFVEGNYDVSTLFLYQNKEEYDIKHQMEARYRILEDVSMGKDSFVNMTFGLQGILQTLRSHPPASHIQRGCKRMFEQRQGFHIVLAIFKRISNESTAADEEGDGKSNAEDKDTDSSGDENDADDYTHYRLLLLDAILTLLHGEFTPGQKSSFRDVEAFLSLTEEESKFVVSLLDDISDEDRYEVLYGIKFI
ncbi:hypothetical protein EON65_07090 [archaeon]|nr:MAG: hypothetical protein EON65_07090 [archaeon]